MLEVIKKVDNPRFLVITPLRVRDKISKETLETISNNSTPFDWVSFKSKRNVPSNTKEGLREYIKKYGTPKYIIKIDNDIDAEEGLLDIMYQTISSSPDGVAYVYSSFKYIKDGKSYVSFPAQKLDVQHWTKRLLNSNFISSNSMIKVDKLEEVGGFVCKRKYERLLDWALWLKFLLNGYVGVPCAGTFNAIMNENSISTRGQKDYRKKHRAVVEDFAKPVVDKVKSGKFEFKKLG